MEAGAEKADFGIGLGEAEGESGFLDREALDVTQEEDEAMFFVEVSEGILEEAADIVVVGELSRGVAPIGDVFRVRNGARDVRFIGSGVEGDGVEALAFADDFEGGVSSDAEEPGGERGFAAEAIEILEGAEERLLGDIFGVLLVAEDAEGKGEDTVFIAVGEGFEGVQIAGLGAADQQEVGNIG